MLELENASLSHALVGTEVSLDEMQFDGEHYSYACRCGDAYVVAASVVAVVAGGGGPLVVECASCSLSLQVNVNT